MPKTEQKMLFGSSARQALLRGVSKAADAIRVTMGARGRLVSLPNGAHTKDGVSVARIINLPDPFENKGAMLVRGACITTVDGVGDGTTLTAVLTREMVRRGFGLIEDGKDAQELAREMGACEAEVLKLITKQTKKVTDARQAASVSANDPAIGEIVGKAVNVVGADGLVTVESAYVKEDEVEIVKGMQIDQGVRYAHFFTDFNRRRAEYNDAVVILYNGKIHDVQGFVALIEPIAKKGLPIVVIANGYDDQLMHVLLTNRAKGLKILPLISPHLYRDEVYEDIAAYTGARVITEGDSLPKIAQSHVWDVVGEVAFVTSFTERTVFQPVKTRDAEIANRIKYIYEYAKQFKEDERREVEKRASRLSGKIAVIRTHSPTEIEEREKRDRYDDAIYAAQAALREGIVVGGGQAFVQISQKMKKDTEGAELLSKVLLAPITQIATNAGRNPTEVITLAKKGVGYNAKTDTFEDLMEAGIVDPAAVLHHAFKNALSVSLTMIATESLIVEEEKE